MAGVVLAYLLIALSVTFGIMLSSIITIWLYNKRWFVRRTKKWYEKMTELFLEEELKDDEE